MEKPGGSYLVHVGPLLRHDHYFMEHSLLFLGFTLRNIKEHTKRLFLKLHCMEILMTTQNLPASRRTCTKVGVHVILLIRAFTASC